MHVYLYDMLQVFKKNKKWPEVEEWPGHRSRHQQRNTLEICPAFRQKHMLTKTISVINSQYKWAVFSIDIWVNQITDKYIYDENIIMIAIRLQSQFVLTE